MGIPSRDEPADDGSIDRWLTSHDGESADQPQDEAPEADGTFDSVEPVQHTQPVDPLTAPLSELIADPVSGPMIHPLLNTEVHAPSADTVDTAVDTADVGVDEADEEAGDEPAPHEPDTPVDDAEPTEIVEPEDDQDVPSGMAELDPHITDVDTTGFTPSAPRDVFAALRETKPDQPKAPERTSRLSARLQRKRKQPPAATRTTATPVPTKADAEIPTGESAPVEARAEPETAAPRITDAAIAGPALAAVLRAEQGDPPRRERTPKTARKPAAPAQETPSYSASAEESPDPIPAPEPEPEVDPIPAPEPVPEPEPAPMPEPDVEPAPEPAPMPEPGTSEPVEPAPEVAMPSDEAEEPMVRKQPPTSQELEDEPSFETLEELLNAATSNTHPPAPLRPFEEEPLHDRHATAGAEATTEPATRKAAAPTADKPAPANKDTGPATEETTSTSARSEPVEQPADKQQPTTRHEPKPAPAQPKLATGQPKLATGQPKLATGQQEGTIDLSARRGTQHVLLVFLLIGVAATVVLAWLAWQEKSVPSIALAAVAAVVTAALWKAHSGAAPATVVVERGALDIRTADSHHRFDLAGHHADFEVEGTPGRHGWKVLIHRTGMPPYKLDASMVDPHEFTEVLDGYRERG